MAYSSAKKERERIGVGLTLQKKLSSFVLNLLFLCLLIY